MTQVTKKTLSIRCARCGEQLTCPIEYKGEIYGYTCIKFVNPSYKKSKTPVYWVEADSYVIEQLDNGRTRVKAYYVGNHYNKRRRCFSDVIYGPFNNAILLQDGKAFIDLYRFKEGQFHI